MPSEQPEKKDETQKVSRRDFCHKGITAVTLSGLLTIQNQEGIAGKSSAGELKINPTFFGPQFYDSREEEEKITMSL